MSNNTGRAFPPLVERVVLGILVVVAVAIAIPSMRDTTVGKWMRGDCTLQSGHGLATLACVDDYTDQMDHSD